MSSSDGKRSLTEVELRDALVKRVGVVKETCATISVSIRAPFVLHSEIETPKEVDIQALLDRMSEGAEKVFDRTEGDPPKYSKRVKEPEADPVISPPVPSVDLAKAELLGRIEKMKADKNFTSWVIRTKGKLEDLPFKALQEILEKGNTRILVAEEFAAHLEHPVFAPLRLKLEQSQEALRKAKEENQGLVDPEIAQSAKAYVALREIDHDLTVERLKELMARPTAVVYTQAVDGATTLAGERDRFKKERDSWITGAHRRGWAFLATLGLVIALAGIVATNQFFGNDSVKQEPIVSAKVEEDPFEVELVRLRVEHASKSKIQTQNGDESK